jgi:spoIIIJ-associated protein
MARREAKRAVQQSRVITLEPMSPRDRRVIHLSLAKFPGVSTRSDGQGNERRVRIIPARVNGRRQAPRR